MVGFPGYNPAGRAERTKGHAKRRGGGSLSATLVGVGVLQTVVYLLFIRAIDLYEREELRYVIPVFLWGLTVAVAISLFFNTIFNVILSAVVGAESADLFTAVF